MDKITETHQSLLKQGLLPVHSRYWKLINEDRILRVGVSLKHNSNEYWLFPFYKPIANFINFQAEKDVPGI